MFRFADLDIFWHLLWLLPTIFVVGWIWARRLQGKVRAAFGSRLAPFLASNLSQRRRRLKTSLQLLCLLFMLLALARPQLGSSLQEVKSEGVEIVLLVDVSRSMMAEDSKPNRLDKVKIELDHFIDQLSGDKVGLVVFAGSSFLVSPLTNDYSALKLFLDSLSTNSVSTQGTVIRPALEEAKRAFERGGVEPDETTAVTRVIVVASDGEDHEEGALNYAKELTKSGIRIYSVGVGTAQGAPVPVRDDFGYLKGYLKDDKGQVVMSTHKGEFLTELAKAAGGDYFHADAGIRALKTKIDQLQKAQFESQLATEYDEKFQVFLVLSLICLLLEILMTERRSILAWHGKIGPLALFFLLLIPSFSHAFNLPRPGVIEKNNHAAKSIEGDRPKEAFGDLTSALADDPFLPVLRMNMALSMERSDEKERALKEYLSILANPHLEDRLRFEVLFNAARLLGEEHKVPEALQLYQKALELEPESQEVKTNIELLLQEKQGGGQGKDQQQDKKNKPQDEKDNKESQNQQDQKQDEKKQQGNQDQKQKPPQSQQPRPFKSQELTERDVKNILQELKRQEEKNRAKVLDGKTKDNPNGPDW